MDCHDAKKMRQKKGKPQMDKDGHGWGGPRKTRRGETRRHGEWKASRATGLPTPGGGSAIEVELRVGFVWRFWVRRRAKDESRRARLSDKPLRFIGLAIKESEVVRGALVIVLAP